MKKSNRKLRKVLLVTCCALALVAISVGATLAYLTDTEAVTNVFTVGKVGISLDEAKTDTDGNKELDVKGNEIRINNTNSGNDGYTNKYHLIPGESYTKDPTVHVDADSESSWIFVKVENGIANIEDSENTIASQIKDNGWTALPNVVNVYYKAYEKGVTEKDLVVFESFTLKGAGLVNGEADEGEFSIDDYADANITVTAYAIQMAGFDQMSNDAVNAALAWNAGNWN